MKKIFLALLILLFAISGVRVCFAASVSKEITAVDEWTNPIPVTPLLGYKPGYLNISVSGTWVGTVALQRRFSGGSWANVKTWETNTEKALIDLEPEIQYRIGSTAYTSGTITVRLGN